MIWLTTDLTNCCRATTTLQTSENTSVMRGSIWRYCVAGHAPEMMYPAHLGCAYDRSGSAFVNERSIWSPFLRDHKQNWKEKVLPLRTAEPHMPPPQSEPLRSELNSHAVDLATLIIYLRRLPAPWSFNNPAS